MAEKFKAAIRTRAPNFTKEDQLLLFEAMKPFNHIIESKQTDSLKQADKQIAWAKITEVFNSNAVGQPRTTENLISCYRNVKSKLKKQHSDAKMLLVDPAQKGALIKAIEEDGTNWEKVASTSNWNDPKLCESGFNELIKESHKEEIKTKKFVMGTGGGPQQTGNEDGLREIRKLIEPQIDGLYTIYDGDASLMGQFQETIPLGERQKPIESSFIECASSPQEPLNVQINTEDYILKKSKQTRTEILRKKKEAALAQNETTCKKTSVNESFKKLSEAKLELVKMQKLVLEKEVLHRQRLQEIELEEIIKENVFKEKMREKQLELIDAKINNTMKM